MSRERNSSNRAFPILPNRLEINDQGGQKSSFIPVKPFYRIIFRNVNIAKNYTAFALKPKKGV